MACGVVLSVCVLMIVAYVFETSARAEGYAGEAVVFCSARWALLINGGIAVLGLVFLVWCLVLNRQVAKKTIALEQSNRNSEFNFRRLIDGMPDAVFIQTDGQLTYANPVACALLGASTPDELLGAPVLGFFQRPSRIHHGAYRAVGRWERLYASGRTHVVASGWYADNGRDHHCSASA